MTLATRVAELTGQPIQRVTALAGGDLSEVVCLTLDDGQCVVAKGGPSPAAEARMLTEIARLGVPVPDVIAHDDAVLVLEFLPAEGALGSAWENLGSVLTDLHRVDGNPDDPVSSFGWHEDYAFGTVTIENAWAGNWPAFWAERRLVNQLEFLPVDIACRVEALALQLPGRLPDKPQSSLLHGDLWQGNVLVSGNRISGLIDPACYYGDPEVDLAMLCLFSQPGPAFFTSLNAPEPGLTDRRPIYQLWPALVHYRLFGSTYLNLVKRLLSEARV